MAGIIPDGMLWSGEDGEERRFFIAEKYVGGNAAKKIRRPGAWEGIAAIKNRRPGALTGITAKKIRRPIYYRPVSWVQFVQWH